MKHLTKHYKRLRVTRLKVALVVIFINIIMIPQYEPMKAEGNTLFKVYVNNEYVGSVGKKTDVEKLVIDAIRTLASN